FYESLDSILYIEGFCTVPTITADSSLFKSEAGFPKKYCAADSIPYLDGEPKATELKYSTKISSLLCVSSYCIASFSSRILRSIDCSVAKVLLVPAMSK